MPRKFFYILDFSWRLEIFENLGIFIPGIEDFWNLWIFIPGTFILGDWNFRILGIFIPGMGGFSKILVFLSWEFGIFYNVGILSNIGIFILGIWDFFIPGIGNFSKSEDWGYRECHLKISNPDFSNDFLGMMLLLHVDDPVGGRPLSTVPEGLPSCRDSKLKTSHTLPWNLPLKNKDIWNFDSLILRLMSISEKKWRIFYDNS